MKTLASLLFIAALLHNYECSIFNNNACAGVDLKPMDGLDVSKIWGVWYNYAASSNYDDVGHKCLKKTYRELENNTLEYDSSYLADNGTLIEKFNKTRNYTSDGVIKASSVVNKYGICGDVQAVSIPVDSVIVYTDYDSIQLRMSCTTIDHFWVGQRFLYYFISIRNRTFNSLKTFLHVSSILKKNRIDLNDLTFTENGPDCPN